MVETFAGTLPAIQRTDDHHYIYQGVTYPGVTSVLRVLDKSGPLMAWAAKNAAEAAVLLGPDRLRELVETVGEAGTIRALSDRANWKRDEAANLGTEIHGWADRLVSATPGIEVSRGELSAIALQYTEHYTEWWQRSGWKLRLSEAVVLSPSVEGVHGGYGGTFDLLCYDADGRTVLADIKTGKGVYREAILQLAAYGAAELVSPMGSQDVYPMPAIDRYAVIHVTRDGVREVELSIGSAEWRAWWACLDLAAWIDTVKGRL